MVVWQRAGRGRGGGRGRQRGGGAGGDGRGAGGGGGAGGLVRLGHRRQGLGQAQEVHRELPAGQRQVTGARVQCLGEHHSEIVFATFNWKSSTSTAQFLLLVLASLGIRFSLHFRDI